MCRHGYEVRNKAARKEVVVDDFMKCWTLLRVRSEDMLYELTRIAGHFPIYGEFVLIVTDTPDKWLTIGYHNTINSLLIYGFDFFGLERRAPDDEGIQYDTN
jgi:hypothetical protein